MPAFPNPGHPPFHQRASGGEDRSRRRIEILVAAAGLLILISCCCLGGLIWFVYDDSRGPTRYVHDRSCVAYDENLVLTGFRLEYPGHHRVLPCGDGQNHSYVSFLEFDGNGDRLGQFNLSWFRGPRDSHDRLITSIAESLQREIVGSTYQSMNETPMVRRGSTLARKDYLFTLSRRHDSMPAGRYVFRIVMLPGPGPDGLAIMTNRRVTESPEVTLAEVDDIYGPMIESIVF